MADKKIVFNTDLDNTIIYSYKHDIGNDKRCVEIYQGREISFITEETYRLLNEVKKHVIIVPTTTRTVEQYSRIDLQIGDFKYALACNGGVLLVDGSEDENWYNESLKLIEESREELLKAMDLLETEKRRSFELRFIRELFVYTKCNEPEGVVEYLKGILDVNLVDVFNNGVKVYVVPKTLNKGTAVKRLKKYIGADYCISAGDSEFDVSMLEAAECGIAESKLAERFNFSEKVKCPPEDKLYSEAMLETVLKYCSD